MPILLISWQASRENSNEKEEDLVENAERIPMRILGRTPMRILEFQIIFTKNSNEKT